VYKQVADDVRRRIVAITVVVPLHPVEAV